MPNWLTGGDPELFSDPNQGQTQAAVSQLSNSNFGAMGAQTAERAIGKRYDNQLDSIKSNPNFGRNAAVTANLTDQASETAGQSSASAYEKGAQTDADARVKGAQLSMDQSKLSMQENELNYGREQDASFGNSFLGHLTEGVAGAGLGALTGGLGAGLAANLTGQVLGDSKSKKIGDATFGKGEIKMIIGKDGTTYKPRADDGAIIGTNVSPGVNAMPAGAIKMKPRFLPPHEMSFDDHKLGHAAFDWSPDTKFDIANPAQ